MDAEDVCAPHSRVIPTRGLLRCAEKYKGNNTRMRHCDWKTGDSEEDSLSAQVCFLELDELSSDGATLEDAILERDGTTDPLAGEIKRAYLLERCAQPE